MRAFNLVALDGEDHPFLIVEAKARPIEPRYEDGLLREVWDAREAIPYGMRVRHVMIADTDSLRLYEFDAEGSPSQVASWPTIETLSHYDARFRESVESRFGITSDELARRIGSWLGDLDSHWKSPEPPGEDGWRRVGLLDRFAKGWTRSEVTLGFDLVR